MSINPEGYFDQLRAHLNFNHYGIAPLAGQLELKEKLFGSNNAETTISVRLHVPERSFAIKLDKKNKNGNHDPLFHFLDDTSKPWSKRCDFVVFALYRTKLVAKCFEFKSETIPVDSTVAQLQSGAAWCRAAVSTVAAYTGKKRKLCISKFVLSNHPDASPYLDSARKYLRADHSVRHMLYREVDGQALVDLDNSYVETV